MSGDSTRSSSPRRLDPTEFAVQLDWDLRAAGAAVTLHRLDRSQVPMLLAVHPSPDLPGGRHAADQQRVRSELTQHYSKIATWTRTWWVRVIESPTGPGIGYSADMRRELDVLQLHAECGAPVRVVSSTAVAAWERERRLPDILTIRSRVVYRLARGPTGALLCAYRVVDPWLAAQWDDLIGSLFTASEEVQGFFDRIRDARPVPGVVLGQPPAPRSPDVDTVPLQGLDAGAQPKPQTDDADTVRLPGVGVGKHSS